MPVRQVKVGLVSYIDTDGAPRHARNSSIY
jgi:hypothetical protein